MRAKALALVDSPPHVLRRHAAAHKRVYPAPLSVHDAVVEIAILGGYQNRSCDGPPGWLTLWRGYQRLMALLEVYVLARADQAARPHWARSNVDG